MTQTNPFNSLRFFEGPAQGRIRSATSTSGMVATAFSSATQAGLEVLRAGGNAIDAAVAAAWALAVCEPSGSGLGGQTTLLIRLAGGRTFVVDGHSCAPEAGSTKTVSRDQQDKGYRACTIPSTPATLGYACKRYGALSREKVMEPALRLAREGYAITRLQRRQLKWCLEDLLASPAAARLFLHEGTPFRVGEVFRQKELAATLARMAEFGVEDFYRGRLAQAIAEDMKEHGGLITEKDLADCTFPVEREALAVEYRDYQVASVPPPGGGLQVLLGLKLLGQLAVEDLAKDIEDWYEVLTDVTYAVFAERDRVVVHPGDLTPSLLKWLLSDERACEIATRIRNNRYTSTDQADPEEPGETTHLCTADGQGNAVSLTQSIQSLFGAKVACGQLGFLYNNYLCTCTRRRSPYQLGSHGIPQSNVAPTLVLRKGACPDESGGVGHEGQPFLILGAAGSRRITSAILHVLSGVIDRGRTLDESVAVARVHGMLSGKVRVERPAATESLLRRLQGRFQEVEVRAEHSYSMGCVQAVEFRNDHTLLGVADPRREGTAGGL